MPDLELKRLTYEKVQDKISRPYILSLLRMNRAKCVNFILFGDQEANQVNIKLLEIKLLS